MHTRGARSCARGLQADSRASSRLKGVKQHAGADSPKSASCIQRTGLCLKQRQRHLPPPPRRRAHPGGEPWPRHARLQSPDQLMPAFSRAAPGGPRRGRAATLRSEGARSCGGRPAAGCQTPPGALIKQPEALRDARGSTRNRAGGRLAARPKGRQTVQGAQRGPWGGEKWWYLL